MSQWRWRWHIFSSIYRSRHSLYPNWRSYYHQVYHQVPFMVARRVGNRSSDTQNWHHCWHSRQGILLFPRLNFFSLDLSNPTLKERWILLETQMSRLIIHTSKNVFVFVSPYWEWGSFHFLSLCWFVWLFDLSSITRIFYLDVASAPGMKSYASWKLEKAGWGEDIGARSSFVMLLSILPVVEVLITRDWQMMFHPLINNKTSWWPPPNNQPSWSD